VDDVLGEGAVHGGGGEEAHVGTQVVVARLAVGADAARDPGLQGHAVAHLFSGKGKGEGEGEGGRRVVCEIGWGRGMRAFTLRWETPGPTSEMTPLDSWPITMGDSTMKCAMRMCCTHVASSTHL
jgi:hypothetical protein